MDSVARGDGVGNPVRDASCRESVCEMEEVGVLVQDGQVSHYAFSGKDWVRVRGNGPERVPAGTEFTVMVVPSRAERWEYRMRLEQAVGDGV